MLRIVAQEIFSAARSLRRAPGFSLFALTLLALGIGANVAIFSVFNSIVLSPLPYPEADRIVGLSSVNATKALTQPALSAADFRDIHERAKSYSALAAFRPEFVSCAPSGNDPAQLVGALVQSGAPKRRPRGRRDDPRSTYRRRKARRRRVSPARTRPATTGPRATDAIALHERATALDPAKADYFSALGMPFGERLRELSFMQQATVAGKMKNAVGGAAAARDVREKRTNTPRPSGTPLKRGLRLRMPGRNRLSRGDFGERSRGLNSPLERGGRSSQAEETKQYW